MKEVRANHYAGPFSKVPFDSYIQSPIGLVPKDGGNKTRLIFHLSYPKNGTTSINHNTPKNICKVKYPDFSEAIQRCIHEGIGCTCGKSDWTATFRHFPIGRQYWRYLVMRAKNPTDQKWYYFIDKCMPFSNSISCAHFQAFSNAIASFILNLRMVEDWSSTTSMISCSSITSEKCAIKRFRSS